MKWLRECRKSVQQNQSVKWKWKKDSFNKTNIKSSLVLVISRLPLLTSLSLLCNSFSFTARNPNPCKKDMLLLKFLINLFSHVRYIHQQLFVFKRLYCSTSYPLPKIFANIMFPHKSFFLCSPHYTHYILPVLKPYHVSPIDEACLLCFCFIVFNAYFDWK